VRTKFAVVITALALVVLAGSAQAKGPSDGAIEGEGLPAPIRINDGEGTAGGNRLIEDVGFFEAAFGMVPSPMMAEAPTGDLGPQLTLRWTGPGPEGDDSVIVQELYPYAEGGPLVYTEPGQVFFVTEHTNGGWFRARDRLLTTLQSMGLPPVGALSGGSPSADGTRWDLVGASLAAVVLLGAGLTLFSRRRERMAPAAP
jgi:hypothetical protein